MGFIESCARPVNVRLLSEDETEALTADDEVLVPSSDFQPHTGLLERARIAKERGGRDKVRVLSVYGSEYSVSTVYVPSEGGEEKWLLKDSGTRISTALFIPDLDEPEAIERLRKALRSEFGGGVVEVWNMRSGPVRDVRWDVYEIRHDLVPVGPKPQRGKAQTEWREVERRLIASGVRDGHERYFMGKEQMGWSLCIEMHNPEITRVDTI
ncbi:hypothetical protein [Streptomyces cucumeris]|uniref:hypothetical protein n=1 Tax=Streptomyces cucumeris TaxID=2962890 RepID=UPI0020C8B081|nr:hypothetical protein [Streptomyces sp. NEAU-Y11]MCP9209623.1 hypothetical protein [Streptomyces sp. NEAU-Y11]